MWRRLLPFHLLLWVALGLSITAYGQVAAPAEFAPLLKRLSQDNFDLRGNRLPQMSLPVLYRDSAYGAGGARKLNFELRLADKPIGFTHRVVQLHGHGYPVSYSVVFKERLVALFKNGKFGCYQLADLKPDTQLEKQLNVGSWKRHWLIDGQLVAQNNKGYFAYQAASRTWQAYKQPVPFGRQPKLYEDNRYLAYADCNGEFGGTAYFYNKQTGQTHRANATCANSIWQEAGQYRLLVSLGHMMGSASSATIADPDALSLLADKQKSEGNWQYSFRPAEKGINSVFHFYGLLLFGAVRYQSQTLYLMHWRALLF